jgi:hypothetical protein
MTNPNEHYPESTPPIEDLARQLVNRRLPAELRLSRISTTFTAEAGYNPHDYVMPLPFIDGVKQYMAHPGINLPSNWPPRPWSTKHGLQDSVESFRFPRDKAIDLLLESDRVFTSIEAGLVAVSALMTSHDPEVAAWRNLAKACHRLRTDELSQTGMSRVEPLPVVGDMQWAAIIVKLDESRPNGV